MNKTVALQILISDPTFSEDHAVALLMDIAGLSRRRALFRVKMSRRQIDGDDRDIVRSVRVPTSESCAQEHILHDAVDWTWDESVQSVCSQLPLQCMLADSPARDAADYEDLALAA
jgi:hypothetical protein